MKVLVIEDSERLQRSLDVGLRRTGFAVDVVGDGEEGLAYARLGNYDVIVLDLMLPKLDGLSLLRQLREEGNRTHVLILSARDQVEQRIQGLRFGADDYLTKPFAFEELVARLQALVRRKFDTKDPIHEVGPLRIDTARRVVTRGAEEIDLTRNEYGLHGGAGQSSENAVEVLVHQLRKKINRNGDSDPIRTRRGHGYLVE